MSANYDVGFGKPPVTGQWKKGQSGNPLGSSKKARERARKARELKKAKPFAEMMLEELCETIAPNVDGSQMQMLVAQGMAKALARDILTGKPVDRRQSIKLLDDIGVFDLLKVKSEEAELHEGVLTQTEILMLEQAAKILEEMDEEEESRHDEAENGEKPAFGTQDLEDGMLGSS